MSVWGKVIGGVAGFAIAGPLVALLCTLAGHTVDRASSQDGEADTTTNRQVAVTLAVIVLGAKMAQAVGRVTRDVVNAFKQIFHISPQEMNVVGKVFHSAA